MCGYISILSLLLWIVNILLYIFLKASVFLCRDVPADHLHNTRPVHPPHLPSVRFLPVPVLPLLQHCHIPARRQPCCQSHPCCHGNGVLQVAPVAMIHLSVVLQCLHMGALSVDAPTMDVIFKTMSILCIHFRHREMPS